MVYKLFKHIIVLFWMFWQSLCKDIFSIYSTIDSKLINAFSGPLATFAIIYFVCCDIRATNAIPRVSVRSFCLEWAELELENNLRPVLG